MNKSALTLLVVGALIFSAFPTGQTAQARGFSFPAEMNKSFAPLSIDPGGLSRLEVTVYNPNVFELTDVSWTDNLTGVQPGILIANPADISNSCGGTVSAAPGGTTLSLSGGTAPAEVGATPGSCTVAVNVTSTTTGNLINTIPEGALSSQGDAGSITNTSPASATLHVDLMHAPTLSKGFSPNTILVGEISRLTIRIRNNDQEVDLTQTSITDSLPDPVVLANPVSPSLSNCGSAASVSAASGGSSVTLNNATVPANSTCTIRVNVTSSQSGIYTNTIPANAIHNQQGVTNASPASAKLNVQDIGLEKEFSPSDVQAGGTTTLTITLRNPTSSAYTGVRLSDTLPGNVLTIVPGSAATTCGGNVTITPPRTVALTNGRVPAGTPENPGTCTITVQVTTPANASGGTYTNTIPEGALQTDQGITNGLEASARLHVYPTGGGIAASKSFTPSTIPAGGNSRLRINIPAPSDTDLTNFSITDHLPPSVTVSNSSPASYANCGSAAVLTAETGATIITLTNGTIRAGTTCRIDVYVTSSTPGTHTNIITPADITNNENRTIPNNITADLTVLAASHISVSKSFTPPVVSPGGISTLTITLQNTNDQPMVDVSVTDLLPGSTTDGVAVAPNPQASTTCTGGTVDAVAGSQTITMAGGTIPAQVADVPGTCTITVDVQGLGSLTKYTNIIPVENVSGTVQGTTTTQHPVQPARADLRIGNLLIGVVKGFDPLTVFGGSASTLSVELVNPNNVQINGIAFTDKMPPGMILANPATPDVGDCGGSLTATPGADSFSFSGGSLQASASCTLTIRVTMIVNGNLTNIIESASVTTFNGAHNPDPAEASLTNLPGASISKAFSPNPIVAGSAASLTFTIQNTGMVALSGVSFSDRLPGDLPVGLEIAESPEPVNHCGGTLTAVPGTQVIKLVNGALAADASCTIVVPVTGNIAGSYTNTIEAGNLKTNEGATNHDDTSDTLVVTGSSSGGGNNGGGNNNESGNPVSGFAIPVTGFQPDVVTSLDHSARPRYAALGMSIEIPVLHVNTSIVGVQILNGGWDVSWLQDQLGWLNGTAYPTWNGNSVLTGHAVNADGKPGVLARLKSLRTGELIFVYNAGYRYTYQVVSNLDVDPDDLSSFRHQDKPTLTLITCDQFDESSGSYLKRVVVRAKLVDVRALR